MSKKNYEELTITDSFIFGKVMQDPKLCRHFLEKLLGIKIKRINYPEREKNLDVLPESHGIRLDVYVDDEAGTVYNIEMQTYKDEDIAKRSRYYQSVIDVNLLQAGREYAELPDSFIIFICDYDVFNKDVPIYRFKYYDEQEFGTELGDGTCKIFLCRNQHYETADLDEDIKAFLRYMSGEQCNNSFIKALEQKVAEAKGNKKWRMEYMAYGADFMYARREGRRVGLQEGRKEGIELGKKEGMKEGIKEGIKEGERRALKEIVNTRQRAETAEQKVTVLLEKLLELGYQIDPEKILG